MIKSAFSMRGHSTRHVELIAMEQLPSSIRLAVEIPLMSFSETCLTRVALPKLR